MTRLPLPPRAEYDESTEGEETYLEHCRVVYAKQENRDRIRFTLIMLSIFILTGGLTYGLIRLAHWIKLVS